MSNIRVLLVEDEEPARELVKSYFKKYSNIEIIGEAADGFNAVKAINQMKPDIVMLDIQLPKLTGFEILELVEFTPVVIFATAFDQFAIKAFEMNAVDYLLKPFSAERFEVALNKAIEKLKNTKQAETEVQGVLNTMDEKDAIIDRVVVKNGTKIKVIPCPSVHYIEAQDDYVMIYADEGKYLKEKTMKYFESHLDGDKFIRIHRSYIVNVEQIIQLEHFTKDSYVVVLKSGAKLKVSDSGYKNLKSKLNF